MRLPIVAKGDGVLACVSIMVSVPREADDPVAWSQDFVEELMGEDHAYAYALHEKHASDGDSNFHIHLMFSPRKHDHIPRGNMQFFYRAIQRILSLAAR